MSDCISRETARQILTALLIETALNNTDVKVKDASYVYEDIAKTRIETWLNLVPNADVVPVVHCEDCKYFIQGKIHGHCDIHCNGVGEEEVVKKNFFCGYGERKKENG